jgi:hypothetical protein
MPRLYNNIECKLGQTKSERTISNKIAYFSVEITTPLSVFLFTVRHRDETLGAEIQKQSSTQKSALTSTLPFLNGRSTMFKFCFALSTTIIASQRQPRKSKRQANPQTPLEKATVEIGEG